MLHLLNDHIGRSYYGVLFEPGCLSKTGQPWGDEEIDCAVINLLGPALPPSLAQSVAIEVCRASTDYVGTTGLRAEWFHDLVDTASVEIGRQVAVGCGSPMTTWHEDAETMNEVAFVMFCLGGSDHVVALLLCPQESFAEHVDELVKALEIKVRDE